MSTAIDTVAKIMKPLPTRAQKEIVKRVRDFVSDQGVTDRKSGALEFPSIVKTPGVCGGDARLVRTRIPIWQLQQMREMGMSEAKILECYPSLHSTDVAQAWGYADVHAAEIQRAIDENESDDELVEG